MLKKEGEILREGEREGMIPTPRVSFLSTTLLLLAVRAAWEQREEELAIVDCEESIRQ